MCNERAFPLHPLHRIAAGAISYAHTCVLVAEPRGVCEKKSLAMERDRRPLKNSVPLKKCAFTGMHETDNLHQP